VISTSLGESKRWKVGDVVSLDDTPFKIIGSVEPGIGTSEGGSGNDRLNMGQNVIWVPKTALFSRRDELRETSHRVDVICCQGIREFKYS